MDKIYHTHDLISSLGKSQISYLNKFFFLKQYKNATFLKTNLTE